MDPVEQFGNEHVSDLSVHPSARGRLAVGAVDGSVHRYTRFTREKSWLTKIANARVCWADDKILVWGAQKQAAVLHEDGSSIAFEVVEHADLAVAGSRLLMASPDAGLISYQLSSGQPILREKLRRLDNYRDRSLITSSQGAVALVTGRNILFQSRPDTQWQEVDHPCLAISFSPDGRTLAAVQKYASGTELAVLGIRDDGALDTAPRLLPFPVLTSVVIGVEWSFDGNSVLILGADGELEMRNVQTTQLIFSKQVHGIPRSYLQDNLFITGSPHGLHSHLWQHERSKLWIVRRAGSLIPDKLEIVVPSKMARGDELLLFVDDPILRPTAIYEVANGVHSNGEAEPANPIVGLLRLTLPSPSQEKLEQEHDLIARIAALSPHQDTRSWGEHNVVVRLLDRLFGESLPRLGQFIDMDITSDNPEIVGSDNNNRDMQMPPFSQPASLIHPELRQFIPILERYFTITPIIDVALVARLGSRNEIIAARITAIDKPPQEIRDEHDGWIVLRTGLPIETFEGFLQGLSRAALVVDGRTYTFLIGDSAHFQGFRARGSSLDQPSRPVARTICGGGPILSVLKEREFFRWRDHHLVVVSRFHDLDNLRESLELLQPLQSDGEHRQVYVEFELPLDVRLLTFNAKAFSLSLRLSNQRSPLPLQLKLRNAATKETISKTIEISDYACEFNWPTRHPPDSRVSLRLSDSELLLMDHTFQLHDSPSKMYQLAPADEIVSPVRKANIADATRMRHVFPPTPTAELTGAVVGPWQLIKAIGGGGYGVVYEARHGVVHHDCAVKVIPYESDDKDAVLERLKRETRTSNEIKHPAIVPIIDGGIDSDHNVAYAAMRRLNGHPLQQKIGIRIAEGEAWKILRPILEALALCHEISTVHRDVHPGNIFVDDNGQVYLLDFGLCAVADRRRVTRSTMTLGHLEYAAPEQVMHLKQDFAQPTADVWSLGVVLYQMLTGVHPFQMPTPVAIAAAAERDPHQPASKLGVRDSLSEVLDKCLQKKEGDRFATAQELLDVLDPIFTESK